MGVSGSGKSTLGAALADRLGAVFIEGDDFHPASNIEKMRNGVPLTDDDRDPWLHAVRLAAECQLNGGSRRVVVACSALKADYRRRLLSRIPARAVIVHLQGDEETLRGRLACRRGHFMPPSLLASQFSALEPPTDSELPGATLVQVPVCLATNSQIELVSHRLGSIDG